jgi:predicted TIM-barrel fold metal-dependent hydrolase
MSAAQDFAIVDAHHHFWDPRINYYPWLCDQPPIPFRYGDYSSICRPYLPADYRRDNGPHNVVKSVYVEAEWDHRDPIGETSYIAKLRQEAGLPTVTVAQAWLDRDDAESVLDRQAAFDFVRSVRHKPRANKSPKDTTPGGMTDAKWRQGYRHLRKVGLRFDLQTPWWHLAEAAQLARDFSDQPIILNHTGLPSDRSPEGIAGWKAAMAGLAKCPNVAVKISGIGMPGQKWTAELNRGVVLTTIELFGPRRCMFASNFPVDGLCGSFDEIFSGFRQIVSDFSTTEQRALFHDNAIRHYGMT